VKAPIFDQVQLAFRVALAASLSLVVGRLLRFDQPLYALLAAIIVTDVSSASTRRLGVRRLGATAIGALCGGMMSAFLPQNPWTLGLGTLVAMLVCIVLGAPEAARVAGYVCGIILLRYGADPWTYALERFLETALGVVVAWGLSLVPKLYERPNKA
jgi:uncharacterized membrane protein YgaE (UPF0421/DUF939 family)